MTALGIYEAKTKLSEICERVAQTGEPVVVTLPLSKSGLVTAGTFVFLFGWNEFIYALLLTSRQQVRTVQFGIRHFVHQFFTDYTAMFAAIVVTIVPSIIIYILFHERIVKGLTSGALKG